MATDEIKPCFYKLFALPLDHGLWPNGIRLSQILPVARLGQIDQTEENGVLGPPETDSNRSQKRKEGC